jgi:hypothetical protein
VSVHRRLIAASNGLGATPRGGHKTLLLYVPIPDAGKRLNVPHLGWADRHLAVFTEN